VEADSYSPLDIQIEAAHHRSKLPPNEKRGILYGARTLARHN